MTTQAALLALLVAAPLAACASAPAHDTLPHAYACDGTPVTVAGDRVTRAAARPATLQLHDRDADRYLAADGTDVVEYTVPHDRLLDATMVRYRGGDRTQAAARATCIARAGYTDTLEHYLHAPNTHVVAQELQLDDAVAETRILEAWHRVGTRFRREQ